MSNFWVPHVSSLKYIRQKSFKFFYTLVLILGSMTMKSDLEWRIVGPSDVRRSKGRSLLLFFF